MKYSEVVEYINNIPKFTKKNSMNHTKRFMELLGNPDKNIKIIHVAGTNGKGSTCAYLSAMLCSTGEKVGLFTSPHLEEMTERICINGQQIEQSRFVENFRVVMDVVRQLEREQLPHPTFFEFLFGVAMKTFAMEQVDYAVIETGLGGRLDATNVFESPVATIITSIGLDHEAYLGNTLVEIAGEKAGIIKKNVPVIYDGNIERVAEVIEQKAKEEKAKCIKISNSAFEIIEKTEKDIAFYFKDAYDKSITWKIKNRSSCQVNNGCLALMALMTIREDWKECYLKWRQALYEVTWAGRMEEIEKNIFVDGAHNVAAIEAMARDISQVDVILFSAVSDKNYREMIKILTSSIQSKVYVVTQIDDARGVPAEELEAIFTKYVKQPIYNAKTVEEAWELLKEQKSEEGKALCLGSLYLVGMLKKICINK